ncbi:hypothetical protein VUR80DRAFT_1955 [Thermomyces stellatus]
MKRSVMALTSAPLVALATGTYTLTVTLPCKTGTPGRECPQYVPPAEPCTQTLPPTTVSVLAGTCDVETVTSTCEGWVCRGPCATVEGAVETIEPC